MSPVVFRNTLTVIGWSQRELAERLGVSHNTTARYASGDRKIPADLAEWLTEVAKLVSSHKPPRRYTLPVRQ